MCLRRRHDLLTVAAQNTQLRLLSVRLLSAWLLQVSCDLTPEQAAGVVTLRERLVDKEQFWMFHEPTWRLLTGWYGVEPGSEVRREYHLVGRRLEVDAQQQHFRLVARPAGGGADLEAVLGASSLVSGCACLPVSAFVCDEACTCCALCAVCCDREKLGASAAAGAKCGVMPSPQTTATQSPKRPHHRLTPRTCSAS